MEEAYNQAQRQWMDNVVHACQDYERHEDERSDFLRGQWLKYIETCVGVNETTAMVSTVIMYTLQQTSISIVHFTVG